MKKLSVLIAGAAIMAVTPAAHAATFIGTTTGCFGAGCTPGSTAADGGLTFTGGSFNQSDANGFLALGGLSDNLGTFSLDNSIRNFTGDLFTLLVNFTSPAGSGFTTFASTLSGQVTGTNTGGVFVNFNNNPVSFNPPGGPAFTLAVNDISVSAGSSAQAISGQIQTAAAVPEPATWAMMLLGFGMLGGAMRRKQRKVTTRVRFA